MKLTEFIRQNDIKSTDGEAFDDNPEFFNVRELSHEIRLTVPPKAMSFKYFFIFFLRF